MNAVLKDAWINNVISEARRRLSKYPFLWKAPLNTRKILEEHVGHIGYRIYGYSW